MIDNYFDPEIVAPLFENPETEHEESQEVYQGLVEVKDWAKAKSSGAGGASSSPIFSAGTWVKIIAILALIGEIMWLWAKYS